MVHYEELGVGGKGGSRYLKLVDMSKIKLKVEMNRNVVLLALLEVIDGTWVFAMAVLVIGEEGEGL